MIKKPSKITHGLIFFISLTTMTAIATGPSFANIDSPQGALDVAGITPGQYAFLDRQKYPRTTEEPSDDQAPAATNAEAVAEVLPATTKTASEPIAIVAEAAAEPQSTAKPAASPSIAKVAPDEEAAAVDAAPEPAPAIATDPTPAQSPTLTAAEAGDERTGSSVGELMELMKQATELAASIPDDEEVDATMSAMPTQGAHLALNIACMLPRSELAMFQQFQQLDPLEMIKARTMEWPADGFIYSAFNATRGRRQHGAIDIVNKKGTPIAAAADGIVSVVANGGKNFSGYGKIVIVDHGKGVHTLYAHCDSMLVKIGQQVKRGEVIATMGRTGRASTDHVHFEVRVAGKRIDPLACIPERPGVVKATNYHTPKKAN